MNKGQMERLVWVRFGFFAVPMLASIASYLIGDRLGAAYWVLFALTILTAMKE